MTRFNDMQKLAGVEGKVKPQHAMFPTRIVVESKLVRFRAALAQEHDHESSASIQDGRHLPDSYRCLEPAGGREPVNLVSGARVSVRLPVGPSTERQTTCRDPTKG
jgi:hypothetical protein